MKKPAFIHIDPGLLILAIVPTCSADISIVAVPGIAVPGVDTTWFTDVRRQKA